MITTNNNSTDLVSRLSSQPTRLDVLKFLQFTKEVYKTCYGITICNVRRYMYISYISYMYMYMILCHLLTTP